MSAKLTFYYLGDDEAYFRALQGEFRKHAKVAIDFKRLYQTTESKIQSLIINIFTEKPDCVFIDFSKHTQDYLHLARLISRTPMEHTLLMVGLVDYLSPPEILKESIITGAQLNFIKSAETFDVVFDVTKIVSPQGIGEHGFANAALKEEWEVGTLCKIGYIHSEGLHIETDFRLNKGDRLRLNHHWLEKRTVPSKDFFVRDVAATDMFYQFKFNADLDFLFIDDFLPPEGMPENEVQQKQEERTELVRYQKKQLKKWLENCIEDSLEKRAKVLVVDYKFHFYQDQPRTDKHSYTIRCQPFFTDIEAELARLKPQVIAFEIDTTENAKNNMESLRKLVFTLKASFPDLNPYIIVFNTDLTSNDLQDALQYKQTLAHADELSPELLIKLADMLQKKMTGEEKSVVKSKDEPLKLFIKKNNLASVGEILKSVTVIKLSETDMILQSDYIFPPGTNLHFTEPTEMFVHIRPVEKPSGKIPEYYGLIHSIGETEKKELRRYVNSIFFRDHDAQLAAETDEFKKLNDLKLQERQAAEAKALEEKKAKEAAEAAEKAEKAENAAKAQEESTKEKAPETEKTGS